MHTREESLEELFGPKIPLGELFSKIIIKSSSAILILRDSQKI